MRTVQRKVELEDVDSRLAEKAKLSSLSAGGNELPNLRLAQTPLAGNARNLEGGPGWRDMGIDTRGGCGDEVNWHRRSRVLVPCRLHVRLHPVDQLPVRR